MQAAQQSGLQGFIANEGSEKKNAVIAWTKAELARRGITLDLNTLDAMIEAIVFEQITQVKIFEATGRSTRKITTEYLYVLEKGGGIPTLFLLYIISG